MTIEVDLEEAVEKLARDVAATVSHAQSAAYLMCSILETVNKTLIRPLVQMSGTIDDLSDAEREAALRQIVAVAQAMAETIEFATETHVDIELARAPEDTGGTPT